MNIIPSAEDETLIKNEIEHVQEKHDEYAIVGTAYRRRGTKLWSYRPLDRSLVELVPEVRKTLQLIILNGILMPQEDAEMKAMIDTRCEIFEAVNRRTAELRVKKYESGKLLQLNNLRTPEGKLKIGAY